MGLRLLIESLLDICMMQAVLWYTDTLKVKSTLEEHSALITDVRFSPSMSRLATSSFDKTVRVWDADNVSGKFFRSIHLLSLYFENNLLFQKSNTLSNQTKYTSRLISIVNSIIFPMISLSLCWVIAGVPKWWLYS